MHPLSPLLKYSPGPAATDSPLVGVEAIAASLKDCPICGQKNKAYVLDSNVEETSMVVTMSCFSCSSNWVAVCPPMTVMYRRSAYSLKVDKTKLQVAKTDLSRCPGVVPKRKISGD